MEFFSLKLHPSTTAGFSGRGGSLPELCTALEVAPETVVQMEQVHNSSIAILTSTPTDTIPQVDAVLTTNHNLALAVRTADCVPVLLAHPSGLVGAIHAGRASTQLQILKKTLEIVRDEFDITRELTLWIGPHICAQCYQIDRERNLHYNLLKENLAQANQVFESSQISIQVSKHCTAHENNRFYSYRKQGAGVPMNYSLISWAKK